MTIVDVGAAAAMLVALFGLWRLGRRLRKRPVRPQRQLRWSWFWFWWT